MTLLHATLAPVHLQLLPLELLLGDLLLLRLGGRGALGEGLLLLVQDELDVAGGAHVRVDATVGAVRAAAHVGGAVDLWRAENKIFNSEFR